LSHSLLSKFFPLLFFESVLTKRKNTGCPVSPNIPGFIVAGKRQNARGPKMKNRSKRGCKFLHRRAWAGRMKTVTKRSDTILVLKRRAYDREKPHD
jgi:hypothetical protein